MSDDLVTIETQVRVTDKNLDDLATTAGYGGITYWARSAGAEDKASAFEADPDTVMVFVEREDDTLIALTKDSLRRAFAKLARPDQQYVNQTIHGYFLSAVRYADEDGLEMGSIDADAADVWVQVAAFNEVRYG